MTFAALGGEGNLGRWQNFSYSGVTGESGLQSISLTNLNLQPNGNDFALDDMSLEGRSTGGVPEASTWALMLVGFGGMGSVLRASRRRMVPALAKI